MSDKAWKSAERRAAKYIGGERNPVSGRQRGDKADIEHAWLSPEVKYGNKKIPLWLHDAMDQAIQSAKPRQIPCVILMDKGASIGDALICFRMSDAKDHWF